MATKGDMIEGALTEIGIASDIFQVSPEERERCLRRLDGMMAEWDGNGIRIGYTLPASPDGSNLDDDAGVPDICHEAVKLNLAVRVAPSFGKNISPDTRDLARLAFNRMLTHFAVIPCQAYGQRTPRGSGNRKLWWNRYFYDRPDGDGGSFDNPAGGDCCQN